MVKVIEGVSFSSSCLDDVLVLVEIKIYISWR
jgi:hypothetical protein